MIAHKPTDDCARLQLGRAASHWAAPHFRPYVKVPGSVKANNSDIVAR